MLVKNLPTTLLNLSKTNDRPITILVVNWNYEIITVSEVHTLHLKYGFTLKNLKHVEDKKYISTDKILL